MQEYSRSGEFVDELTADMVGCWLVTTEGSQSVWNLSAMTYFRVPLSSGISGDRLWDRQTKPIFEVEWWPKVGFRAALVFLRDDVLLDEGVVIRTRVTSEVQSVEHLVDKRADDH